MIYKPRSQFHARPDPKRCREAVWDREIFALVYQCSRKPTQFTKKGLGFCTQHAKMYQRRGPETEWFDENPTT